MGPMISMNLPKLNQCKIKPLIESTNQILSIATTAHSVGRQGNGTLRSLGTSSRADEWDDYGMGHASYLSMLDFPEMGAISLIRCLLILNLQVFARLTV